MASMRGVKFIYNPNQMAFYISKGCKLLYSDIHNKSGKRFWAFNWEDTQEAYSEWCNRKY